MNGQDILVVAETIGDQLTPITLEMLGAARPLAAATGGQVVVVVPSADGAPFADALAAADRIELVNDPLLANFSPAPLISLLEQAIRLRNPRAVLIGSSSVGLDIGPLLGARLEVPVVNGCLSASIEAETLKATSSFYGGKLLADVSMATAPAILLVAAGAFKKTDTPGTAEVETSGSPVALEMGAVTFKEMQLPDAGDVDITQQEVLVAVGRGVSQEDDLEVAEELAEALGGEVAASRPIVDQGWLPTTRQIGKSGMTVKPKCYFALGISGAPEHVEGMKDSSLIIAVNSDSQAPIFEVADYGVVADLVEFAPALTAALKGE
jgi:electron transfer flavoprotein alpha subunit